jgi:hypothetical protein
VIQNWFILTAAQRDAAVAFNNDDVAIDPRAVDNSSPGVGLNLNDNATDYDPGEPVTLAGTFVAPKRIVDDPEYQTYAPGLIALLIGLPFAALESETIFAPS